MYFKHFRYAEQISIGNEMLVHQNNELTPAKVMNAFDLTMQGIHLLCTLLYSLYCIFIYPVELIDLLLAHQF